MQQAFFCVFLRRLREKKKTLGLAAQQERSNLPFREISEISVRKELIRAHSCPSWALCNIPEASEGVATRLSA